MREVQSTTEWRLFLLAPVEHGVVVIFVRNVGWNWERLFLHLNLSWEYLSRLFSLERRLISRLNDFHKLARILNIDNWVARLELVVCLGVLQNGINVPVVVDDVLLGVRLEGLPHLLEIHGNIRDLEVRKVAELLVVFPHKLRIVPIFFP